VLNLSKTGINTPPTQNEVFTFDEMGNCLNFEPEGALPVAANGARQVVADL
jgi:hypothetical protein